MVHRSTNEVNFNNAKLTEVHLSRADLFMANLEAANTKDAILNEIIAKHTEKTLV